MIRFKQLFNEGIEDFEPQWKDALSKSEELRVGVDLMKHLKQNFSGEIYIVGGVPRDILMGGEIDDVDLATNMNIKELSKKFSINEISKDDSQPVYTIKWKKYNFDLASFRIDSGGVGRQNNIPTTTDSFEADSARRDATLNAFGIDETGKIFDYQGGLDDLKNKIIRAVGDPKKRFQEDATRILRIFRFAAKTGFDIDPKTFESAKELKHLLSDSNAISVESIAKEFYKSAKSGKTLMLFMQKLLEAGILQDILPELTNMEGFTHNPKHHPEGGSTVIGHIFECLRVSPYTDPVINLAVAFHDLGKATTRGEKDGYSTYYGHEGAGEHIVRDLFNRLKFNELDAQDKKNILLATKSHMLIHNINELSIKKLKEIVLNDGWDILVAVGYCDEASRGEGMFDAQAFREKIANAENKVKSAVGGTQDEARKKIKQYIDGEKLMNWFPNLRQNAQLIGQILPKIQDHILEELANGREPTDVEIKNLATSLYNSVYQKSYKDDGDLIWEAYSNKSSLPPINPKLLQHNTV